MVLLVALSTQKTLKNGCLLMSSRTSISVSTFYPTPLHVSLKLILYIDVSVAGSLWGIGGSPSLAHLIHRSALEVPHPTDANRSLWDARDDSGPFTGKVHPDSITVLDQKQKILAASTGVLPLGSGSDFTTFLQRLGVSVTAERYGNDKLTSGRLRAWIRASSPLRPMQSTTTTRSMTPKDGKKCMRTPDSIVMFVQ